MRKIIIALLLSTASLTLAQNPEIKVDLPTILPPSPTVAALMKFEEIPVSNYTGVPDVSIPLFTTNTYSKDVNFDVSLKYHPSSVAASERASDVGLGWSLFAGGSISRTVKGMPDEIFKMGSDAKIGLYQNSVTNFKNNYYGIFNELNNENTSAFDAIDEYLWDAQVRGRLDTEHDLWQFNFMGNSGRFYIKKNESNQLVVTPLDEYRVKIINIYGEPTNPYEPTSFEIYDEKGYKYVFDVVESTKTNSFTNSVSSKDYTVSSNFTYSISYDSAFHLSKVYDCNGNLILDILYRPEVMREITIDSNISFYTEDYTTNFTSIRDFYLIGFCGVSVSNFNPYPTESLVASQRNTTVKKIQQVKVVGKAKIDFDYIKGREDTNFHAPDSAYVFKGLIIKDWKDNIIKKVKLEQGYSTTIDKRMMLHKVSFKDSNETKSEDYTFEYRENVNPYGATSEYIGTDYWGYFNLKSPYYTGFFYKKPDPVFGTTELLQKMIYPTGGCSIFDFEANTYSYDGSTSLTNFDENPDNWNYESELIAFTTTPLSNSANRTLFFNINETQDVTFVANINTHSQNNQLQYFFTIYKVTSSGDVSLGGVTFEENDNQKFFTINGLTSGQYKVAFYTTVSGNHPDFISSNITAFFGNKNTNNLQYLYGGGNRIARIGYFKDANISKTYYQNSLTSPLPEKEKKYNYNFFDNILKSSGSLTYSVPKFVYNKFKLECTYCQLTNGLPDQIGGAITFKDDQSGFNYKIYTTFNNLNPVKTQGADIGYKNVTVRETGNGFAEFEYSSPIEFPEDIGINNLSSPFLPTKNIDYKRGLLKKERVFSEGLKVLSESILDYSIEEKIEVTGIRTYYNGTDFINIYGHTNYIDYKNFIQTCPQFPGYLPQECNDEILTDDISCECFCYFGRPRDFVLYSFTEEAYGWAKLISKTNKSYFYDSGNNQNVVQTTETYQYNPINKQISESTVTNSLGEVLKTNYFYHTGNSTYSQNRISEIERIESYRGTELLSKSQINYVNNWVGNASYLPQIIVNSKGTAALENRVRFNRYDEFSNPLEMQQENGTPVCYIWGYNKSQPVAKIENIAYNSIPSNLITAIQTATDTGTESSVISALNSLRSNAALNGAMVTTYTYIPLVGVHIITDPKGDTMTYEYDSFGRLSSVKDKNGNMLSENQYHYRTQN